MKSALQFVALLLAFPVAAAAQAAPAATGGLSVPIPPGTLNYSVRYAHTAEFGGGLGDWQTDALSGSLDYSNQAKRLPFSLTYGGGYNWTAVGPSYGTGLFQHLLISQGVTWRRWAVAVRDDVSYTPEAPTFGFTGIPGLGEPIVGPNPIALTPESILSLNTHVIDNTSTGDVSHILNRNLSADVGGSYNIFRFPNGDGFNTNTTTGQGALHWRMDARNSVVGTYVFSRFAYPDFAFSFQSQSGLVGFDRVWSRSITTAVSVGPQWTSSSNSANIPSSIGLDVNAALTYLHAYNEAGLSYTRSIDSGSGYLIGAEVDQASANYSRVFSSDLRCSFTGTYMRTSGLTNNGVTNAKFAGAEATRRLGNHFSVFANYSFIDQSSSSLLPGTPLGQLIQVAGFGFGYSPRRTHTTR